MPYVQKWVAPKKDLKLAVLNELPQGYKEPDSRFTLTRQYKYATLGGGMFAIDEKAYHYCPECKGWIPGNPNEYEVNTLNSRRLAGRRGTEYNCKRCGHKIGFFGMMS